MNSIKNKVSYTSTIDSLRNDLHRDVVQTASLMDVSFEGFYEFENPIDVMATYYNNDGKLCGKVVKVVGISWDGNIISENDKGDDVYLRYKDLTIEQLDLMLVYLRQGEFKKSELTLSI